MSNALYVKEVGPAGAPTLVFLHGGGGAGWTWEPQISALSGKYHCLVPDLPQHGNSEAVAPFTMRGAADMVSDCIAQRAHGGKAHVIGLSLGAQVTVALLASAPERAISALISSPLLRPMFGAFMYTKAMLRWSYWLGVSPLKGMEWYTRLNMRYASGIPDAYFEQFKADYNRLNARSFAQIISENMHFRLPPQVSHAGLPVLVIVGKREGKAMQQSVRDLVAALPDAQLRMVDVGRSMAENHNWSMNAPELFTRMVDAWVSRTPLPAELTPLA